MKLFAVLIGTVVVALTLAIRLLIYVGLPLVAIAALGRYLGWW